MQNSETEESVIANTVIPIDKKQLASQTQIRDLTKRGRELFKIPYEKIATREGHNARTIFDQEKLVELSESILSIGLETPLQGDLLADGTFILTKGERRWRAIGILRSNGHPFDYVEAVLNPKNYSEIDRTIAMLVENVHESLSPREEAEALLRLKNCGLSPAEISKKTGINAMQVSNRLMLANLTDKEKDLIDEGKISETAAVKLARTTDSSAERIEKIQEAAASAEGKLKVKSAGKEDVPPAEGTQPGTDFNDDFSPGENHERYDNITSGGADDKSMQGTSAKASESNRDPAVKSKDQPSQNDAQITSGKATAYDLMTRAIAKFKEIDDEIGPEKSPKLDTLIYEMDKTLSDIRMIFKKN